MKPLARLGDGHNCPLHGNNEISSVASRSSCDGRPLATIGDRTSCGATITEGSAAFVLDGRSVATIGSRTDHGGVIIKGSRSLG